LKRQLRRTAAGLIAAGTMLTAIAACGAPSFTYAADTTDHAYFKVPAAWQQVNTTSVSAVQAALLSKSAAGAAGGVFAWSRAYAATPNPPVNDLLTGSVAPVVYASVQDLSPSLRAALSFDYMRDLLFPVTGPARQAATANGSTLTGFTLVSSTTIATKDGVRGINELYEYTIGGLPDAFDQTVLTNSSTTKLYLLLVQCYQDCFASHAAQIKTVVNSFTVRGS
jgi:hypothetical protein